MTLHADALFAHDDRGRMLQTGDPVAPQPAPRLFIGRTAKGVVCRVRADVPEAIARDLSNLCASEPSHDDSAEPLRHLTVYRRLLRAPLDGTGEWAGPAMRFPETCPSVKSDGQLMHIDSEQGPAVRSTFPEWEVDAGRRHPFLALRRRGRVVAICASARIGTRVHEAGVETLASQRGRGFGCRVVQAWAASVRALGAEPLYSTSWSNQASLGLARKLGLIRYGVDFHFA